MTTAPPLVIRPVLPQEHAAVGGLVVRAYTGAGILLDDGYARVLADVAGRAAVAGVYVALDPEGGLVGTVTAARAGQPYADVALPGELEFRMLAVEPERTGQGIGRTLVGFCADLARSYGDRALVLSVVDSNSGALAAYDRLGFTRRPERDCDPVPWVHLLVLTLDLTA